MAISTDESNLIRSLFVKKWRCQLSRICTYLISKPTVDFISAIPESPAIGDYRTGNGVIRKEFTENDDIIAGMMTNQPSNSTGTHLLTILGDVNIDEQYVLSIADLAEVIYKEGSVTLLNPTDVVEIYENINRYKLIIERESAISPHYVLPPEQDIKAFTALSDRIMALASKYTSAGEGNSGESRLASIMHRTSLAELAKMTGSMTIGKLTPQGIVNPPPPSEAYSLFHGNQS